MVNTNKKQESEYNFPFKWGRYTCTKLIGKGGMGEIFLADDPICDRSVALKRIQKKMLENATLRKRFLAEARIAAQLPHPSIIPVYELVEERDTIYYTMPYVEGKTLQEILVKTRLSIEHELPPYPRGSSIQSLMLMFLNLCNAIEFTHSKGFLHRDIKPSNIIVGEYSDLVILDWGVATKIENIEQVEKEESQLKEFEEEIPKLGGLTLPGRAVGTVEFMAPERVLKVSTSVLTDIYSLGGTLHFMLTLQPPFKRPHQIKEFRKIIQEQGPEKLIDPQEVAPHREITPQLSRIVLKCLDPNPTKRYQTVQEIITDVQRYIQGQPEWIPVSDFKIDKKDDWEFQEHVPLTKHMAISRYTGVMEWAMVMLSKEFYSGNIQIKTKVKLKKSSVGLGLLMCVPDTSGKQGPEKGYLVWIGSKEHPGCKFLHSNVEVTHLEQLYLEPDQTYTLAMERQGNVFRFSIDGKATLSHISHVPIAGGHFGLVLRDGDLDIDPLTLLTGSQNVYINCLSIPDALFLSKYYVRALTEYRRISHSFKGRAEGRDAIFRAGLTLIEQGKASTTKKEEFFAEAEKEFARLHSTPGAPIEYLGKSLVYQAEGELKEETKALELALRMYPNHPLRYILEEHIIFRLHESAQTHRYAAYTFTLLTICHLPKIYEKTEAQSLIRNLTKNWEPAPFIQTPKNLREEDATHIRMGQQLAFWLADPQTLYELTLGIPIESQQRVMLLENSFAALTALDYPRVVNYLINEKLTENMTPEIEELKTTYSNLLNNDKIEGASLNTLRAYFSSKLTTESAKSLIPILEPIESLESELIWALLLEGKAKEAGVRLKGKEYFTLEGCYIALTKGEKEALAHFEKLTDTPFPPIDRLLGYALTGKLEKISWFEEAFLWEKVTLYRQLSLYYSCINKPRKKGEVETLIEEEFEYTKDPLEFIGT